MCKDYIQDKEMLFYDTIPEQRLADECFITWVGGGGRERGSHNPQLH